MHPVLTAFLAISFACGLGVLACIACRLCRRRKMLRHYSRVATEIEEGLS